jgi:hypothetical protein
MWAGCSFFQLEFRGLHLVLGACPPLRFLGCCSEPVPTGFVPFGSIVPVSPVSLLGRLGHMGVGSLILLPQTTAWFLVYELCSIRASAACLSAAASAL